MADSEKSALRLLFAWRFVAVAITVLIYYLSDIIEPIVIRLVFISLLVMFASFLTTPGTLARRILPSLMLLVNTVLIFTFIEFPESAMIVRYLFIIGITAVMFAIKNDTHNTHMSAHVLAFVMQVILTVYGVDML